MRKTHTIRLNLIAASIVSAFGMPMAAADDVSELTKPDSSVSVGVGQWSRQRNNFGVYDGQPDNGAYLLFDANLVKRDDATGTWTTITGRNLGLDNREFRLDVFRQGDIGAYLEYSSTPRVNPVQFSTGLLGIGTQSLSVNQTATPATPTLVTIRSDRELIHVGGFKRVSDAIDLKFSFKDETKSGTRLWGRGHAAEFLAEPLDSTTDQLELVLDITTDKLQLSGGYYGSWYRNRFDLITVNGTVGGNSSTPVTYLSQPMDNQAHQLFLNGGYNFTDSTRATFKMAYTRAMQDEHLPTQDIAGLSFAGSPQSLEGRLDTRLLQAGITSRPLQALSVNATLRYHDMNDKTPVARFVQTNALCPQGTCVDNTPFSITTQSGKVDAIYRLPYGYSVVGGVELRQQARVVPVANTAGAGGTDTQRVVPLRSHQDEATYRLEGRKAMSESVNGSASISYSDRTGSAYSSAGAGPGGAPSDLINPIHLADRGRAKARIAADWAAAPNLSILVAAEVTEDNYNTSASRPYGLLDGSSRLFSLDLNYTVNDMWQVIAWYSHDRSMARQLNRRDLAPVADMTAELSDTGYAAGLGVVGAPISKTKVGADVQWSRNRSRYPQTLVNVASGAEIANPTALNDIVNESITLKLFAQYAVQKNADVRVDLVHQRWQTDDWSWTFRDGSPFIYTGCSGTPNANCSATTTPTDGTVAIANQKQMSNFAGIKYIYRFQ